MTVTDRDPTSPRISRKVRVEERDPLSFGLDRIAIAEPGTASSPVRRTRLGLVRAGSTAGRRSAPAGDRRRARSAKLEVLSDPCTKCSGHQCLPGRICQRIIIGVRWHDQTRPHGTNLGRVILRQLIRRRLTGSPGTQPGSRRLEGSDAPVSCCQRSQTTSASFR
jgi:hypothetical protein